MEERQQESEASARIEDGRGAPSKASKRGRQRETNARLSDAEKCRLIQEFEGIYPNDILSSDYSLDLRATMRAARHLPEDIVLVMRVNDGTAVAEVQNLESGKLLSFAPCNADPARAAFEALAAYLLT